MDLTIGKSRFHGKNMDLMDVTMKEKWKVAENTMESYHEIMCIGILMIYSQIDTHLYIR